MPKIERSPSLVSSPRVEPVARPTPAAPAAVVAPAPAFSGQATPVQELAPRGARVSKSADPSALWGEAPKADPLDPASFAKLSPAEQRQTLTTLRAERDELSGQILERLGQLDVKWKNSRLSTRTEALHEYRANATQLDPTAVKALEVLLVRADASQKKINELRAKADRLPRTPEAKKEQAALRTELARELRAARSEQSKVVAAATAVVDDTGLKNDRLAVTEQVIDPAAPAPGSGASLLEKIGRFLKLDWFFSTVANTMSHVTQAFAKEIDRRVEASQDDAKARQVNGRAEERLRDQRGLAAVDPAPVIQARAAISPRRA